MKMVFIYVLMVGAPVLALWAVLRLGETLDAPVAISGAWILDEPAASISDPPCGVVTPVDGRALMMIAQSGRYVQLKFDDARRTVLVGKLQGDSLSAHVARRAEGEAECADASDPVLAAVVERRSGSAGRLIGAWSWPDCADCPAVAFGAERGEEERGR